MKRKKKETRQIKVKVYLLLIPDWRFILIFKKIKSSHKKEKERIIHAVSTKMGFSIFPQNWVFVEKQKKIDKKDAIVMKYLRISWCAREN